MMQLGVDGVFVGSGIFKSSNPPSRAVAMAQAVTHYKEPKILAELSSDLGQAMFGITKAEHENKEQSKEWVVKGDKTKIWNSTLGDPKTFKAPAYS